MPADNQTSPPTRPVRSTCLIGALLLGLFGCGDGSDDLATGPLVGGQEQLDERYFAGCSSASRTVDTLDFFVPDDPNIVIVNQRGSPLSQRLVRIGQTTIKWGAHDRYELHTWDRDYIYLRYDNTWGEGPGGASSYGWSDVAGQGGRWMKRRMRVGEQIMVDRKGAHQNYAKSCSPMDTWDLKYEMTLLYHCANYDIGELGSDEVIVLRYMYWDHSGYELFFYSRKWGWVRWQLWRRSGSQYVLSTDPGESFRTEIKMCGGAPCSPIDPEPACVDFQGMVGRDEAEAVGFAEPPPIRLSPGQRFAVAIAMLNSGTSIWRREEKIRLGVVSATDAMLWGQGRIDLPVDATVTPGRQHVFHAELIAPMTPGTYAFQWRMLREGVSWFGVPSDRLSIRVEAVAPACGDGVCNGSESCSSCSRDCDACADSCGDGVCGAQEDCASCSRDCVDACGGVDAIRVQHGYRGILGRVADAAGTAYWTGVLDSGTSLLEVCQGLFGSAEFAANRAHLSADELADELYRGILERPADPEGHSNAAAQIRAGNGATVARDLMMSNEFAAKFLP